MENKTSKKKVLNNNAIGILLVLNILVGMVNMVENMVSNDVAYANENALVVSVEEKRKESDSEVEINEHEAVHVVTDVENTTEHIGTMKLYYAYGNENEAWFTARKTSHPNEIQADWYVDKKTLSKANIEVSYLTHNEAIEVIYVTNKFDEYFEIIAVE